MLAMVPLVIASSLLHGKGILYSVGATAAKVMISAPLIQSAFGMVKLSHVFNGVCWFFSTLAIIYLVSPWLMAHLIRIRHLKAALFGVPVFMCVWHVFLSGVDAKVSFFDDLAYGSPYMRVWFVIYGMMLARVIYTWREKRDIPLWVRSSELPVAALCIAWFVGRNSFSQIFPSLFLTRLVDIVLCAALLFVLSFEKGTVSRLLEKPKMMALGHLAMYIYLIHYPLRMYWEPVVLKRLLAGQTWISQDILGLLSVAIIVTATMLLSVAWNRKATKSH